VRTGRNVYRRFIEFEERAARVYLQLASRFASRNPSFAAFWLEMAMEEKQHAGLLQFCSEEGMIIEDVPGEAEIRRFDELFRTLEKRAGSPEIDVNRAFELAAELEGSEVNAVYCHLTTPLHVSSYLLKRKIVASPTNHLRELASAGRKFGADAKTVKKLERLKEQCPTTFFYRLPVRKMQG